MTQMRRRLLLAFTMFAVMGFHITGVAQERANKEVQAVSRPAPAAQTTTVPRYVVQLGAAFGAPEKADELCSQLRHQYPSAYTQYPSGAETLYRVRIGPYKSKEEAQQVAGDLTSQGFRGVTVQPWKGPSPKPSPIEDANQTPVQQPAEAMLRALTNLSEQIGLLNDELRKLRRDTDRNSGMMELLLNEDRLAKLEDKIQETQDHKVQLDAREQELVRRSRNIAAELVLRGGLRREESEAAIRADIQRALDDVHNQQAASQQRVVELTEQAARLRARIETLRKKFDSSDDRTVKEEK